jgi:wyosine [tRNA(Phe)-imidazoG37] synthetase (radical SAM superfamily)
MAYFTLNLTSMYKHIFGPVPSRRLGMSLGVDLVPHKVCSLNCVYCECGPTSRHTLERKEYVPLEELKEELDHYFSHHPDPEIITLSGAGEPTLHAGMGEIILYLKSLRPEVPVAVITNSTLLSDAGVRKELMRSDIVLPSLDAATEETFRKINRPVRHFSVENVIRGLADFRKEYRGAFWLEVLILPGYNDNEENIAALDRAIRIIKPHKVQLNTLDRPGVIAGLVPADRDLLEGIMDTWGLDQVEIVAPFRERHPGEGYRSDMEAAILETLSRRPCTTDDLGKILGLSLLEVNKYLRNLEASGRVKSSRQERGVFYRITPFLP